MRRFQIALFGLTMLGIGFLLGTNQLPQRQLTAQDSDVGISDSSAEKIRDAYRKLQEASEALQSEGRYAAVTEGVNAFLVLSGGGNAEEDLKSGRGVDPETFAALYSGKALPEIQDLLETDDQGRILYNNEVVRMYSKSRLQRLFAIRSQVAESPF
ncbi:MAG: hypothetical protein KDA80_07990 [Planctomycetaceae bacterium]|nr:hypothetical protein [Planctomycetaceae bacterium]